MDENRRALPSEMPHVYFCTRNKQKQNRDSEGTLSAARPGRAFQRPLGKRSWAGGSPSMSPPGRAGLEQPLSLPATPRAPAVAGTQRAAGGRFPARGVPGIRRRRRRSERAGASDPPVRGATAALAGGGFKRRSPRSAGGSAPPSPF